MTTSENDRAVSPIRTEDQGVGLTDDQRVTREKTERQDGPRVQPGPADEDRQTGRRTQD